MMHPTKLDFQKLDQAIINRDHYFVKQFVANFGAAALNIAHEKYSPEEIYPDRTSFYPLHTILEQDDLALLEYFKSIAVYVKVDYTIESNFNSRADQFMDKQSTAIISFARQKACSAKTINFLEQWLAEIKK